jgi:GNAT superfamily N-acetyltransferase
VIRQQPIAAALTANLAARRRAVGRLLIVSSLHGSMNADHLIPAMTDVWRQVNTRIPGSRLLRKDGAAAWITGIQSPAFNTVLLERVDPPVSSVAALLDEAAEAGVPFTLSLRPGCDPMLAGLAAARGMKAGEHLPLMVLDATAGIGAIKQARGLDIRQLAPHEAAQHTRVAAAAFGGPEERFMPSPDLMLVDGLRCYAGEVDGRSVATGIGITAGGSTGIFSVATDPEFQHRGFGTAVTARAVADGVLAGAAWCWLHASSDGYRVYRNLGFRTVETWSRWSSGSRYRAE